MKLKRPMPNVSVDRPCDVHFIEAYCRGLGESVHCDEWDNVPTTVKQGVVVMDCPLECCYKANKNRKMCKLEEWEER